MDINLLAWGIKEIPFFATKMDQTPRKGGTPKNRTLTENCSCVVGHDY